MSLLFLKFVSARVRDWDENLTEEQATKAYDKMVKIEEEFGDLFTGSMPFHLVLYVHKFNLYTKVSPKYLGSLNHAIEYQPCLAGIKVGMLPLSNGR